MAEGWSKSEQNTLCRYFLMGYCRDQEKCKFSHDREALAPSIACQYYLKGLCQYGDSCRFNHSAPEPSSASSSIDNSSCPPQSQIGNYSSQLSVEAKAFHCVLNGQVDNGTSNWEEPKLHKKITLRKKSLGHLKSKNESWADAPEFVPRQSSASSSSSTIPESSIVSYAQILRSNIVPDLNEGGGGGGNSSASDLCADFLMTGFCMQGANCSFVHGLMCDVCQLACLHPFDEKQRNSHIEECSKLMEEEMEHSFGVARSRDKVCGICMDVVMERNMASQRRFGILPNCCHCFCIDCIRKWRQSKQFANKIVRSCPECRVQSDYVIPSRYWVDDKDQEEKDKLVNKYREALSSKACKYFNQGEGQCPFGNKCFYLHALPDGTKKDVGPPKRKQRFNADCELQFYLDNMVLWDFIEEREHRLELLRGSIQTLLLELELEDLADEYFFADDTVSEASDL